MVDRTCVEFVLLLNMKPLVILTQCISADISHSKTQSKKEASKDSGQLQQHRTLKNIIYCIIVFVYFAVLRR